MRALILDHKAVSDIAILKKYAEDHPMTMDDLLDVHNGEEPVPGARPEHCLDIPIGFKVVFTVELQQYKIRHLSVAVTSSLPNPAMVQELMKQFGFQNKMENCIDVWIEPGPAINVVDYY